MTSKLALAAVLAVTLAACDRADNSADNARTGPAPVETTSLAAPSTAADFANMLAASDQFEIEAARIAAQKATDPKVKEFAAMMDADHGKSSAALRKAAGESDPPVALAPTQPVNLRVNLTALDQVPQNEFDALYIKQQVAAHTEALSRLEDYSEAGTSPQLRAFAQEAAPVVRRHLEQARNLQR